MLNRALKQLFLVNQKGSYFFLTHYQIAEAEEAPAHVVDQKPGSGSGFTCCSAPGAQFNPGGTRKLCSCKQSNVSSIRSDFHGR